MKNKAAIFCFIIMLIYVEITTSAKNIDDLFYSCQSQGYHVLFIGLDFSGVCIEIGNKLVIVCHLRLPFSFTYIDLINLNVSPSSYLVKA